ncbi:phosphonate transport system ATP-binding protein [Salsuginibacillus halophilus]|uniref:Phosphonate transport system ATP-binding protein n=1 Tax=Salsuginibacillus halophilus TaxID=517424 RepID=A0A2P8HWM3_9BACI|nr:phosphonate ABC transporter ATP-binding protein [Salsuginibacillus halophilus]PSL50619.1 phosphonate transport system ATP-binding protein [Salsuginibacillus halophilus]
MIKFDNVSLTYPNGYQGLKNINLEIPKGEFVVIVGLSGAGKSTLIRSINQMVRPTEGQLIIDDQDALSVGKKGLREMRRDIGMIFQNYNLVKRSSVLRNVLAGRLGYNNTLRTLVNLFPQDDLQLAMNCLDRVGITDKAYQRADTLSGGQQQRVSIARALAQKPGIILADEPVASLDPPTAHAVMKDLRDINKEDNITMVINLHAIDLSMEYADRIIGLREGEVVFDGKVDAVTEETFEDIYGRSIKEDDLLGEVETE